MTREEAKSIILKEAECVTRQGKTGQCCRDELGCGACPLVMEDVKILEAYIMACKALEEHKQGEWERISMDKYIRHASYYFRCSVCGEDTIGETNFCPNCGASMKGGDEK